jgi:hypothetical protein
MKRLIVLAAICAVVGSYYFFFELPSRRSQSERQARESRVFDFEPTSIHTIRRESGTQSLQLVYDGNEWRMLSPRQEPAETRNVLDFLTELSNVERFRRVDESGENALEYGLGRLSETRVVLQLEGKSNVSLEIGNLTPTEGGCYYRILGEEAVDVADAALHRLAQSPANEFRRTQLWDFADSTIVRVGLISPTVVWSANKDARGLWHDAEDPAVELRQWLVDDLVYQLARSQIRGFEREALPDADFAAYGLLPPAATLVWAEADGDSGALQLGNDASQPGLIFARRDREDSVLLLSGQLLQFASTPIEQWIDRNPIDENFKRIREIEVVLEDGTRAIGSGPRGFDLRTVVAAGSARTPEESHIALRNVYYGVGRLDALGQLDIAPGQSIEAALDRWVATVHLRWDEHERKLRLGWNGSGATHWMLVDDVPKLYQVDRGLYFRLQGWVAGAQP